MPDAKRVNVSFLVSNRLSCHVDAIHPCFISSLCTFANLCNHGNVGLKMRHGEAHCGCTAILRQKKINASLTNCKLAKVAMLQCFSCDV